MDQAACHLQLEGGGSLYKTGGLYGKEGGARELLAKEKKGLFLGPGSFSLGEEEGEGFDPAVASCFHGGGGGGPENSRPVDYLSGRG